MISLSLTLVAAFPEPRPPEQGGDDSAAEQEIVGDEIDEPVERRRSLRELIEEVQNAGVEWVNQGWLPWVRIENTR